MATRTQKNQNHLKRLESEIEVSLKNKDYNDASILLDELIRRFQSYFPEREIPREYLQLNARVFDDMNKFAESEVRNFDCLIIRCKSKLTKCLHDVQDWYITSDNGDVLASATTLYNPCIDLRFVDFIKYPQRDNESRKMTWNIGYGKIIGCVDIREGSERGIYFIIPDTYQLFPRGRYHIVNLGISHNDATRGGRILGFQRLKNKDNEILKRLIEDNEDSGLIRDMKTLEKISKFLKGKD